MPCRSPYRRSGLRTLSGGRSGHGPSRPQPSFPSQTHAGMTARHRSWCSERPRSNTPRITRHSNYRVSLALPRSCYYAHELRTSQAECRGFESRLPLHLPLRAQRDTLLISPYGDSAGRGSAATAALAAAKAAATRFGDSGARRAGLCSRGRPKGPPSDRASRGAAVHESDRRSGLPPLERVDLVGTVGGDGASGVAYAPWDRVPSSSSRPSGKPAVSASH